MTLCTVSMRLAGSSAAANSVLSVLAGGSGQCAFFAARTSPVSMSLIIQASADSSGRVVAAGLVDLYAGLPEPGPADHGHARRRLARRLDLGPGGRGGQHRGGQYGEHPGAQGDGGADREGAGESWAAHAPR